VTLVTAAEFAGLIITLGGASEVLRRAVRGLRRFARLLDGFLGDGTARHPSVPDRLSAMEERLTTVEATVKTSAEKIDSHVDGDAQTWKAEGEAWGHRLDSQVAALDSRVSAIETKIDN